jgi:hypothetical protein
MALIPQYYHASTFEVAQQSLERGYLRYPAVCFIEENQSFAWVTQANTIIPICGYNQITEVVYSNNVLYFKNGAKNLWAVEIGLDSATIDALKKEIIDSISLESYAKMDDVITLINGKIGDYGEAENVIDYINNRKYADLEDKPILHLYGNLANAVILSELDDGVYCITGQYVVGGDYEAIHTSDRDVLFTVEHLGTNVFITKVSGSQIVRFIIDENYHCVTDKYVTEQWMSTQDFLTTADVETYIAGYLKSSVDDIVEEVVEQKLDNAFTERLYNIEQDKIANLFA